MQATRPPMLIPLAGSGSRRPATFPVPAAPGSRTAWDRRDRVGWDRAAWDAAGSGGMITPSIADLVGSTRRPRTGTPNVLSLAAKRAPNLLRPKSLPSGPAPSPASTGKSWQAGGAARERVANADGGSSGPSGTPAAAHQSVVVRASANVTGRLPEATGLDWAPGARGSFEILATGLCSQRPSTDPRPVANCWRRLARQRAALRPPVPTRRRLRQRAQPVARLLSSPHAPGMQPTEPGKRGGRVRIFEINEP